MCRACSITVVAWDWCFCLLNGHRHLRWTSSLKQYVVETSQTKTKWLSQVKQQTIARACQTGTTQCNVAETAHFFHLFFSSARKIRREKEKKNCGEAKSMWKSNLFTWNNEIIKERKLTVAVYPFFFSLLLIPPETPDTISGYKYSPVATVLG